MILKIYSRTSERITNLNRQFFQDTTVRTSSGTKVLTPQAKAEQLGRDTYGHNYRGHILERDGEVISNTLENREVENSDLKVRGTGPLVASKALQFNPLRDWS